MDKFNAVCDVLVVGGGPAGSACAQLLARSGLDVALVDQHAFPRDKTCGDGLIPDALAALKRLGVYDEVMAVAQPVRHVSCFAPRGGRVDVPGTMCVLPRRELDHIVYRAALAAGARALPTARFEAPLTDGDRVVGARLSSHGETLAVQARWVVLATGAAPQAMLAAGLCQRRNPSGVALRGYIHHEGLRERIDTLQIVWHRRLAGGYGWIFPLPGDRYNIGAGLTGSYAHRSQNLRELFAAFCDVHPDARALTDGGQWVGKLEGAPLRCSLEGARWSRPGLLATGETVGSTYAFTGEGIGKAMQTGLLAAEAIVAERDDDRARARYEEALRALKPRFDLYAKAEHVNRHPWLTDLVIWRARKSPRILRRMSGVLEETQNPGRLLSWRGVTKLLFE
ncbi:MAG: NAD(P)/FAD-dependent oxidoreductase [Rubrivivax sp.]|nr:NAD(P)/FAD-dependent oxidoreductase [Rubrivivax sp.]